MFKVETMEMNQLTFHSDLKDLQSLWERELSELATARESKGAVELVLLGPGTQQPPQPDPPPTFMYKLSQTSIILL